MITEKELNEVLSVELYSITAEPFIITEQIKEQIINNFKKAGLVEDE